MMTTESCGRHLPADLFPEVMCRLPVKSLLRFRCVSRSWLSLVDDDVGFARLHLNTFKNNCDETRLFTVKDRVDGVVEDRIDCVVRCSDTFEPISETPLDLGNDDSDIDIVSSVDGLILLSYSGWSGYLTTLKLWNPSLREIHDVSPLPPAHRSSTNVDIGFGYDPLAKDYKLVKIVFVGDETFLPSVAIYTVGAGSWRIIPCPEWRWQPVIYGNVYLNGSLYFIGMNGTVQELVSFDLSSEEFSVLSSKPSDDGHSFLGSIGLAAVDGQSSLFVAVVDSNSGDKSVWGLEMETMKWTKRCTFPFNSTKLLYCKKNGDMWTTWTKRRRYTNETGYEVASYSPEKNVYTVLRRDSRSIKHVCGYVESLILHQRNRNI